ncbi:MAG: ABC-type transport system involved in multi-copper enzyme maturation permease subunit [Planctomycetota bacterium]|jgi:ABC-type transport system involved in multi-copper enzyme maturation permease subunit
MSPQDRKLASAETHLEVYRPFQGELRQRGSGTLPVLALGLRIGAKRKLPMIFLYAVPVIATVVYAFIVYGFYAVENSELLGEESPMLINIFAKQAMKNFEARTQIAQFLSTVQLFALLTGAWYGTGLIASDLRSGALQLWFARPLGRPSYVLARFLTVGTFTSFAVLVPGLVILLVATINSPDYSFASDEGDLFWRVPTYSIIWITTTGLVALAVSSIAQKRAWALASYFGLFLLMQACGLVLSRLVHKNWGALGPLSSLRKLSDVVLGLDGKRDPGMGFPDSLAWWCVASLCAISLLIVAWRVRRVEVIE